MEMSSPVEQQTRAFFNPDSRPRIWISCKNPESDSGFSTGSFWIFLTDSGFFSDGFWINHASGSGICISWKSRFCIANLDSKKLCNKPSLPLGDEHGIYGKRTPLHPVVSSFVLGFPALLSPHSSLTLRLAAGPSP